MQANMTKSIAQQNYEQRGEWLKAHPSTTSITVQGFTFTTTGNKLEALRRNLETKSYSELQKLHAELYSTDKRNGRQRGRNG